MLRINIGGYRQRNSRLSEKKTNLKDVRSDLRETIRELEKDSERHNWLGMLGSVVFGVSLACDALIDIVAGGRKIPLIRDVYYYDGLPDKFTGNRYQTEIKHVKMAQDAIREELPPRYKFLADTFGNLARNTLGIVGYMQDHGDNRDMYRSSMLMLRAQLKRLDLEIDRIERALESDSNVSTPPPAPAGVELGSLR